MMFELAALVLATLPFARFNGVRAQRSDVTCDSDAAWEKNDIGEDPCLLWALVMGPCTVGGFVVSPLSNPTYVYNAPGTLDIDPPNDCACNVVTYNLMAACTWCQPGATNWLTEPEWHQHCATYNANGVPANVSSAGIHIPAWAFLPDNGTTWSPTIAQAYAAAVSPGSQSLTQTSTSTTQTSTSSSPTSTAGSGTSTGTGTSSSPAATDIGGGGGSNGNTTTGGGGSNNTAAIVGGVVGGVAAILIVVIGVLLFLLFRRRRLAAAAAASGGAGGGAPAQGQVDPNAKFNELFSRPFSVPPPGATPMPYQYVPSTPGIGYDGAAPPTASPPMSPAPMSRTPLPMPGPPAYGQHLGAYPGLPEAS